MKAVLETVGGVIRVFKDDAVYGDPFEMSVFIVADGDTAVLKGLKTDDLDLRCLQAIRICLREHGFTEMLWHRWKADGHGGHSRKDVRFKL